MSAAVKWLAIAMLLALPMPARAQHLAHVSGMVHGTVGGASTVQSSGTRSFASSRVTIGERRLPYPYALGYAGIAAVERREARIDAPVIVGIVDASAGYVLDDIARAQISARLRIAGFLDVEGRYDGYFERTGAAIHAIDVGRLGVGFRALTASSIEMHIGAAVLIYGDVVGIAPGYAMTFDVEAYPIAPLVLRADAAVGQLGSAVFFDGRASVGCQLGIAEIYVGYHALVLESGTQDDVLHGPVVGIRLWIT